MADYDSDSSAENDDVSTNVLLGYASKEPTEDVFSQLGGLPTWLDGNTSPDGRLAKCKVCNSVLSLLLQLNGDLPDRFRGHERRLYILGCKRKVCRRKIGSVRAIRAVRTTESARNSTAESSAKTVPKEEKKPATNIGETLFGVKSPTPAQANPFASASTTPNNANPFSASKSPAAESSTAPQAVESLPQTFAKKARLSSPAPQSSVVETLTPESWPENHSPYSKYHLDADNEYLDPNFNIDPTAPQAQVETNGEGSSSAGAEDEKTLFESSMDKTFQRFADRLAQNPEQVLRYEFGGQPLLYSKTDAVGKLFASAAESAAKVQTTTSRSGGAQTKIPRCSNCGGGKLFELQLTPHAIVELEAEEVAIDGMEWGTIIVGVCSQDCQEREKATAEVGYVEEWVGVQWEEVADHRSAR